MKKWHVGDVVILPGAGARRATVEVEADGSGQVTCVWFNRRPDGSYEGDPQREKFASDSLRFPNDDGE